MMFVSGEYRAPTCGGLADSISRVNLTKYIRSLSVEVLAQTVHIIVLVHGYRNLRHLTKTTKANAAPEHHALSGSAIVIQSTVSIARGFPSTQIPAHHTFQWTSGTHRWKWQWPMIVHCPLLNHLDQHTLVLDWCRTRRPFRTGSVIVGKKPPSLSVTILAIFSGDKL